MIISNTNNGIYFAWRNENKERESEMVTHSDYPPYFYVRQDAFKPERIVKNDKWNNSKVYSLEYEEGDWLDLEGRNLTKVKCRHPNNIKVIAKELVDNYSTQTYEADVQYHYKASIDRFKENHPYPEYEMRKWYWDMEWMQGGEHDGKITCIVFYDTFDDEYTIYAWFPNKDSHVANAPLIDGLDINLITFDSEEVLLRTFVTQCAAKDPDMLIAWFGNRFDLPQLLNRCATNNVDARLLSPVYEVSNFKYGSTESKFNRDFYGPKEQPIKGRIVVSLDVAFERQWIDSQRGTLPTLSLDYVSETILGNKKLVSEKFPEKNEFFRRAWLEDTDTYLEYALIDVDLIRKIDETNNLTEAMISLQRILKAPFEACFHATHMASIYFTRNASWKVLTGGNKYEGDYEGALIYNPTTEETNGLHFNVAAFDFAGLYPSMMIARNISWETKSAEPTEFAVNIHTPRDFSPVSSTKMLYYKTDKLGLLPKSVMELKKLRNEYKKNMKNAQTKEEYAKWNNNQLAVKRLMASFYGIIGNQGFGWADIDMAASITASSREAIREAAFKVREL